MPRLINTFGISVWGEITFSQIIINYFIWFIDWSFPRFACKQISIYENNKNERNDFFVTTLTTQFILFLISTIFISTYAFFFSKNPAVYNFSILILFGSFLQSFWYLNGREKIYETAMMQLLNKLIFASFVFTTISQGKDSSTYFLYLGISSVITGIICMLRIIFGYQEKVKVGNLRKSIKLIKKSYILFNSSIVGNITNSCIPFIITSFYSVENLGIYNIAERIKNICIQIINPFSNSMFPKMSKLYDKDKYLANRKLIGFVFFFSILGLFILIILNMNIDFIISYFIKEKISGINDLVRILTFSFLINIIYELFINQYLVVNNLFNEINKIRMIVLFSSISIGIPLIYYKGIYGAALTSIAFEAIGLLCAIYVFKRTKLKNPFLY